MALAGDAHAARPDLRQIVPVATQARPKPAAGAHADVPASAVATTEGGVAHQRHIRQVVLHPADAARISDGTLAAEPGAGDNDRLVR